MANGTGQSAQSYTGTNFNYTLHFYAKKLLGCMRCVCWSPACYLLLFVPSTECCLQDSTRYPIGTFYNHPINRVNPSNDCFIDNTIDVVLTIMMICVLHCHFRPPATPVVLGFNQAAGTEDQGCRNGFKKSMFLGFYRKTFKNLKVQILNFTFLGKKET